MRMNKLMNIMTLWCLIWVNICKQGMKFALICNLYFVNLVKSLMVVLISYKHFKKHRPSLNWTNMWRWLMDVFTRKNLRIWKPKIKQVNKFYNNTNKIKLLKVTQILIKRFPITILAKVVCKILLTLLLMMMMKFKILNFKKK